MSKHVIVGAGAVGQGVARELAAAGHEVVIVSRSGRAPAVPGVRAVAADATDTAALTAVVRGAEVLFNCANPPHYHRWATEWPPMAQAMLGAAVANGTGYVIMGNLYGYGPVTGPIRTDHPLVATGPNGRIRIGIWRDALAAHEAGHIRVTEARASDFLGPESGANAHLGDRVIPRVLAGKTVRVFGSLDAPHSFTYVPDVARTLATLATDDRSWGRAWHVPTNAPVSQRDAIASFAAAAGVPVPRLATLSRGTLRVAGTVVPVVRALREVLHQFEQPWILDATETTAVFGIEPTRWDECVRTTLAAYLPSGGVAHERAAHAPGSAATA
ncbi:MAG: NAD-dependent epimerase/dehydratase family protein [Acidimicrobiia bacterium]